MALSIIHRVVLQGIAIAAVTFMRCSFVMRFILQGWGQLKEQRHEAEEGEEIEEVSLRL
jgi:hypothetical protein